MTASGKGTRANDAAESEKPLHAKRKSAPKKKKIEQTANGHYVLIDGRRWRATDPSLSEDERKQLVNNLMQARRDVAKALREKDAEAEREARGRVNKAKVALGERGAKWWERNSGKSSEKK